MSPIVEIFDNCKAAYYEEYDHIKTEDLAKSLSRISGKPLKKTLIRQYIFKNTWKSSELVLRARCHVKAASEYIKFLNSSDYARKQEILKVVIADLKYPLLNLEEPIDLDFIGASTNTIPSVIHYKHMKDLFYRRDFDEQSKSNYQLDLLVLYGIRLSFESRVLRAMGIDYVTTKGRPVGLSSIIKISRALENIEYPEEPDWTEIGWVLDWLNERMHRHLRPYPWTIHQAFLVLDNLIESTVYTAGGREIHSFYGTAVVTDELALRNEITQRFEDSHEEIKIVWRGSPEILKIEKSI